jgi:hypothetical protein
MKVALTSQVLVPEVEVVAEGGGWLVCQDPFTTRQASPAPSPAG